MHSRAGLYLQRGLSLTIEPDDALSEAPSPMSIIALRTSMADYVQSSAMHVAQCSVSHPIRPSSEGIASGQSLLAHAVHIRPRGISGSGAATTSFHFSKCQGTELYRVSSRAVFFGSDHREMRECRALTGAFVNTLPVFYRLSWGRVEQLTAAVTRRARLK